MDLGTCELFFSFSKDGHLYCLNLIKVYTCVYGEVGKSSGKNRLACLEGLAKSLNADNEEVTLISSDGLTITLECRIVSQVSL
jgi:hypothetical protein